MRLSKEWGNYLHLGKFVTVGQLLATLPSTDLWSHNYSDIASLTPQCDTREGYLRKKYLEGEYLGKKYLEGEYLGKKHSCLELAVIQKALGSLIVPAQGLVTSCYKVDNWMKAQGLIEKAHLLQGRSGISAQKDFALIQPMSQ